LVEHATENRSVGGSIPPLGTIASISSTISPSKSLIWIPRFWPAGGHIVSSERILGEKRHAKFASRRDGRADSE
jgi:hypothetical protein